MNKSIGSLSGACAHRTDLCWKEIERAGAHELRGMGPGDQTARLNRLHRLPQQRHSLEWLRLTS